jgi:hypothetical protein
MSSTNKPAVNKKLKTNHRFVFKPVTCGSTFLFFEISIESNEKVPNPREHRKSPRGLATLYIVVFFYALWSLLVWPFFANLILFDPFFLIKSDILRLVSCDSDFEPVLSLLLPNSFVHWRLKLTIHFFFHNLWKYPYQYTHFPALPFNSGVNLNNSLFRCSLRWFYIRQFKSSFSNLLFLNFFSYRVRSWSCFASPSAYSSAYPKPNFFRHKYF